MKQPRPDRIDQKLGRLALVRARGESGPAWRLYLQLVQSRRQERCAKRDFLAWAAEELRQQAEAKNRLRREDEDLAHAIGLGDAGPEEE